MTERQTIQMKYRAGFPALYGQSNGLKKILDSGFRQNDGHAYAALNSGP
jgi:hypothetical protein